MNLLAQMPDLTHGWDYRMWMWLASMLLVALILFLAAIAVFVGRSRSQRPDR